MKLKIPKTIENFVNASNEVDLDKTLPCFAQDATVLDQKENISGHGEISEWFKKFQSEYTSSISPTGIEEKGDRTEDSAYFQRSRHTASIETLKPCR